MQSEHMEKLRRRAEQTCVSNLESGFDPARPWDWVFALAARDRDFWTAHKDVPKKIRMTSSSALMQSQSLERTESVVWTTNQIVPTDPADQNEAKSYRGKIGWRRRLRNCAETWQRFWRSGQHGSRHLSGPSLFQMGKRWRLHRRTLS